MSKISTYDVAPVPKLADKLIGTSVGGTPDDGTYNFTLQELLTLFLPNIPANNLQGVLNYGNTATQDINLTGTIYTTDLDVSSIATILDSFLTGDTHITGGLFDVNTSIGTAGQVLTSTGFNVEWYTIPTVIPDLQQVLTAGNTANVDILLNADIQALDVSSDTATFSTDLTIDGTLTDGTASVGTAGKVLSSTGTGVQWVSLPVYSATSPLFFNSVTGVFSIQVANGTQDGYLTSADWITFNGKQCLLLEVNEDVVVEGFRLEESESF
jgi:competence protein ComGC